MSCNQRGDMTNRSLISASLFGLIACVGAQAQAAAHNPPVGVGRTSEIAETGKPPLTTPQPGLYILTPKHYSFVRINGTQPLPDYPSNDKPSDADKVAVFNAL